MKLKEIHSQERAIEQLQRGVAAGRTAHAYLFVGADGVGKRTTAQAFAKMLLCHDRREIRTATGPGYDSCGTCRSCMLFESGGHPDYQWIYKELIKYTEDGKRKGPPVDMPVDVIREFLIDKVGTRPTESRYIVYMIEEAEKVNAASQNAMLKVLEEPPPNCVIILLCSRLEKMLPTTRSRCQTVAFGPVDERFIVEKLRGRGVDATAALYWARLSEGSVGTAMAWAELDTGEKAASPFEIKRELVERITALDAVSALDSAVWMGQSAKTIGAAWSEKQPDLSTTDLNRRAQRGLVRMVLSIYGDVIYLHSGREKALVNQDQIALIKKIAAGCDAQTAAENVLKIQPVLKWIDSSVNEKLIFEQLLLRLALSDILLRFPVFAE
jgi:DNA polymerase-3 subunit delta'